MFNIYTNNQSINHYIYADDTAIAVQDISFETVEKKLTMTMRG